jgi:hypothetical protein
VKRPQSLVTATRIHIFKWNYVRSKRTVINPELRTLGVLSVNYLNAVVLSILLTLSTPSFGAKVVGDEQFCYYSARVYAQTSVYKNRNTPIDETKARLKAFLQSQGASPQVIADHMQVVDTVYSKNLSWSPEMWFNYILKSCMSIQV